MPVEIESSYRENNLGQVLFDITFDYKPRKVVEFGVYRGYSTVCIAQALRANSQGHVIACDLWEGYAFNHTTMDVAQANLDDDDDLGDYATLWRADYYQWLDNPCKFDMLHVDISNDGDVIEKTLTKLAPQIEAGSIVVFEGGSAERDKVGWMTKFHKRPINQLQQKFGFEILDERFPSISIARKKW